MDVYELAPKVELHLHLEGATPLETLSNLVLGRTEEVSSPAELEARFAYTDFPHFIDTWWWMTGFLDTEAAFVDTEHRCRLEDRITSGWATATV